MRGPPPLLTRVARDGDGRLFHAWVESFIKRGRVEGFATKAGRVAFDILCAVGMSSGVGMAW